MYHQPTIPFAIAAWIAFALMVAVVGYRLHRGRARQPDQGSPASG